MVNKKINLYIVDIEESIINRLEELFYKNPHLGIKVIGYSHNYNSCVNDFSRARDAHVFLINAFLPDTMGVELIAPIKKVNPNAKVIICLQKNTRNLAQPSKEKGADVVIQKPFKAKQLIETIHSLVDFVPTTEEFEEELSYQQPTNDIPSFHVELNKPSIPDESNQQKNSNVNSHLNKRALFDVYSENPTASKLYKDDEDLRGDKPNVVCVFTSPGSNGKTTMLVNTAIAIHRFSEYKPKICIVDFNLLFPSVLYKFHQDDLILCKKNIYDICEDLNHIDEKLINQALVTHEPTGIKILDTPSESIRDWSKINRESIQILITQLREMFDLVLIDTSTNIRDDATSYPITIADKGIVLLEPDLANLLHTRKFMSMMNILETNLNENIMSKLQFVLNKESSKNIIHVDTIKKTLFNTDVRMTIPEDPTIITQGNKGEFIIDSQSIAVRNIKELARLIYPFEKELYVSKKTTQKNGFMSSIFKKKK